MFKNPPPQLSLSVIFLIIFLCRKVHKKGERVETVSCPLCQKRLRVKNLDSHLATSHRIQQHEVTDARDVACSMGQPAVDLASNAAHSASKLASGMGQHASGLDRRPGLPASSSPGQLASNLVSGTGQPANNLVSGPGQPASNIVSGTGQPASNLVSGPWQPASNLVSGPGQPASNLVSGPGQPASTLVSGPGQPANNIVSGSGQPADNLVSKLPGQPASDLVGGLGKLSSHLVRCPGQPASNLVSGLGKLSSHLVRKLAGQPASNLVSGSTQEDGDDSEIVDVKSNMAMEPVHQESFHFIAVKDTVDYPRKVYVKESRSKDVINMNGPGVRDVASYGCKNSGKVSAIKKSVVTSQNEDSDTITRESEEKIIKRRRICVPTVTTYRLK